MMEKNTLWQWAFNLLSPNTDTPEPRKPMAVPNSPARGKPLQGSASLTEDEWNEQCNLRPALQITNVPAAYAEAMRGMTEDELRELYPRQAAGATQYGLGQDYPGQSGLVVGQADMRPVAWEPGIEHSQPYPVKENRDGTLYYKGKVYRMIGDHGHRNKNDKRRQG